MTDPSKRRIAFFAALGLLAAGQVPCAAAAPADPYAAGVRSVQRAVADGDLELAEGRARALSRRFPGNPELLALRGRILFWRKRYDDAAALMREAQRLKPSREVAAELERAVAAGRLERAERAAEKGDRAEAERILAGLLEAGSVRYDAGLRLARLRMQGGDPRGGSRVLERLLAEYPKERDLVVLNAQALLAAGAPQEALSFLAGRDGTPGDPQLLALRGRALARLGRPAEALTAYRLSLALAEDREVREEAGRAEAAELMEKAARFEAQGENAQAVTLLRLAFEAGGDRYGAGLKLASLYGRMGEAAEAAEVYRSLKGLYPADREIAFLHARSTAAAGREAEALELLDRLEKGGELADAAALKGRLLYLRGAYPEAQAEYLRALALGADPAPLAAERGELEAAAAYRAARELVAAGDWAGARPLVERLAAGEGPYAREARLMKLRHLVGAGAHAEAARLGAELSGSYPGDPELAPLYAEALIGAGQGRGAARVLEEVPGEAGAALRRDREELLFRARQNWLKVWGAGYDLSGGVRSEESAGVAVSRDFAGFTGVAGVSRTSRFGDTDTGLTLDLYRSRRPGEKLYGSLHLTLAPGADVLAKDSLGVELNYPRAPFEFSASYNRLNFEEYLSLVPFVGSGTDVLSGAVLYYLPNGAVTLGERVYWTPENGGASSVTTLRFEPGERLNCFLSFGFGNSAERPSREEDLLRYRTLSFRGGGEYRFHPALSAGAEASSESRRGLYDRQGMLLFLKYWWP